MNKNVSLKSFGLVIFAFISLIISQQSYAQDWRGLLPMQSNREEVENLLGKPEKIIEGFGRYKNKDETVSVWYSTGNCQTKQGLNWNVGKGVVTTISVRFEKEVPLNSLKWDVSKYSKRNHPTAELRFFYTSPDEDIDIQTFVEKEGKEEVWYIEFRPGKKYTHLLCEELK